MPVNVHFILRPGERRTAIKKGKTGERPYDIFDRARRMIESANAFSEQNGFNAPINQGYWGAQITGPAFNHIRYVLT